MANNSFAILVVICLYIKKFHSQIYEDREVFAMLTELKKNDSLRSKVNTDDTRKGKTSKLEGSIGLLFLISSIYSPKHDAENEENLLMGFFFFFFGQ